MSELSKGIDLQAEAEIGWWRDAHDLAEGKRQHLEKVMRQSVKDLDLAVETEDFADFWKFMQRARKRMQRELT